MKIMIRVDSGSVIGTGHLWRCMALADVLMERGCTVILVTRAHDGDVSKVFDDGRCMIYMLPVNTKASIDDYSTWLGIDSEELDAQESLSAVGPVDAVLVDHYGIGVVWEKTVKQHVTGPVVAIDDLGRAHAADVVVDYNLGSRTYTSSNILQGPRYALMGRGFRTAQPGLHPGRIDRVHVCFGGSDPTNETERVLKYFINRNLDLLVDVVVCGANRNAKHIRDKCASLKNVTFMFNVTDMMKCLQINNLHRRRRKFCVRTSQNGTTINYYHACRKSD